MEKVPGGSSTSQGLSFGGVSLGKCIHDLIFL